MNYASEIVDPGDRASQFARHICYDSHNNCAAFAVVPHKPGDFRGPIGVAWKPHVARLLAQTKWDGDKVVDWTMLHETENDGAGGKPQFTTLAGTLETYRKHAWEIIAMTRDDFSRSGRFAGYMANELNVRSITDHNYASVQALFEGLGAALKEAQLVNITGEIAIMKTSVTSAFTGHAPQDLDFTWGATCMGLSHRDRLITGQTIRPGLDIIGLVERGYRCNGGSWFVRLIQKKWGCDIATIRANAEAMAFVSALTAPSISYGKAIEGLVGWNPDASLSDPVGKVHGIAHITGGGLWGKLGDLLPEGVGADLHNMISPPAVLIRGQEFANDARMPISDLQCYGTFHGGCGMVLVVEPSDTEVVIKYLGDSGHIIAHKIGETTSSPDSEIFVASQFAERRTISSRELKKTV